MASRQGLQGIEHRSWQRVFEDGIWDIAIGLTLLAFGLSIIIDFAPSAAILVAVLIPSLRQFKRRVAEPRVGRVQFQKPRQRQLKRIPILLSGLVVAGVGSFGFMILSAQDGLPEWAHLIRDHFVLVIGLIWSGALALAGWFLGVRRLYIYAALLLGALVAVDLAPGYSLGYALVSIGGVIGLVGLALLLRFIRRYPKHGGMDEGETRG